MDGATVDRLLAEQRRYYRERAPEYDDWWFRRAGYALDAETATCWFADVRELEAALEAFGPRGDVLELAAGTGIWASGTRTCRAGTSRRFGSSSAAH
jgi:hypothetical protein